MVVCQYFLKGTCKFGSNCRNDHPSGGMGFGKSSSFGTFSKNQFGSTGTNNFARWQGSSSTDDNTDKVIQIIKTEMNLWEVSKMWPFSCFSHSKEAQCLPGLLDFSPEEIRLEAYKEKESGNFDKYCQSINQLSNNFIRRRSELKSLTAASWGQEKQKMLAQNSSGVFSTQSMAVGTFSSPSSLFSSQSSHSDTSNPFAASSTKPTLFGNSMGQSIFGKKSDSMNTSLFGSNQSSSIGSGTSSTFGSGSFSTFGSKQQSSLFGSGQQPAAAVGQQSFFGGGQQSTFGGGQKPAFGGNNQSIFGGAQQSAFSGSQQSTFGGNQPSLFGGTQQSTLGSGQKSTFGGGEQSFPFSGNQQSVSTGGLFSQGGQQRSQGTFAQVNPFSNATQQQSNLLGQPPNATGNTAANAGQTTTIASNAQNPFLQASIQNKQQESASTVADLPSLLQLSEKDLEAYKADRFTLGQVPECPPPIELC